MKKELLFIVLALFSTNIFADCNQRLKQHLQTDLTLSYQEFDQTMGQGLSVLE